MNKRIYQYSKELKVWIWLCTIQCSGSLEQYWFEKGSFCYEMHLYALTKIWNPCFMQNVKTTQISLS